MNVFIHIKGGWIMATNTFERKIEISSEESLEKIAKIKDMILKSKRDIILEVDGGIKLDNVRKVLDKGANLIVSGSGFFNKDGIRDNYNRFEEIFKEYR